jgi:hypothetical protein
MATPMNRTIDTKEREDKCVKLARKQVQFQKKWGKWGALFNLIFSLAFIGMGFVLIHFVMTLGRFLPQPPKVQDAERQGLVLGVILGFIAGFMFYKGTWCLVESIKSFRGDLNDRLLVEYHDGLVSVLNDRASDAPPGGDTSTPRSPPVTDACGG